MNSPKLLKSFNLFIFYFYIYFISWVVLRHRTPRFLLPPSIGTRERVNSPTVDSIPWKSASSLAENLQQKTFAFPLTFPSVLDTAENGQIKTYLKLDKVLPRG